MNIDKGIPIPGPMKKYPFEEMDIGDSILDQESFNTASSRLRIAAKKHGKKYGKKFTSKKTDQGVRVWRIE